MSEQVFDEARRRHMSSKDTWLRGFFMLVVAIIYGIANTLVLVVALFQFVATLLNGTPNRQLLDFGRNLSAYTYEIALYLTFNRDIRPWPFSPWPSQTAVAPTPDPNRD